MEGSTNLEKNKLFQESNGLYGNFFDSESPLANGVLDGQVIVLIPTDNPSLAKHNLETARRYEVKNWKNIIKISASRTIPEEPYTVFSVIQNEEQSRPV